MNCAVALYERQCGNYNWRQYDFVLSRLSAHNQDCWRGIAPSNFHADFNPEPPIFAAKFANCLNHRNIIAIANEDGKIAVQDTNVMNKNAEEEPLIGDQCHNNAVFDLEWIPGQMQLVSASGDHTASLWQLRENKFEHVRSFHGHTRSVKTAAFRKGDPACFATGGRDGAILIWDIRSRSSVGNAPKADNCIYSGHAGGPGTPHAYKRRATRQTPKLPPNASSSSITGLVFQDDNTLVSCGAGDGIIKVWDLRRNYSCYKKEPLPKHSIPHPGTSTFKGYTNLLIDNAGQKLYVNCMDHNIYCYNLGVYATEPLISYTGLTNSTFYIKSSLSPDGQYLISGSSDEKAYIWNVKESKPLLTLVGHTVEVTCVAWGRINNDIRIVTCSDDARHKIWRIKCDNLEEDNALDYRGKTEICAEYKRSPLKRKLTALENTPKTIKRLVEQNETTPSSTEKVTLKRSYSDLCGDDIQCSQYGGGGDSKRQLIETRARRLFAPTSSTATSAEQNDANTSSYSHPNHSHRNTNIDYGFRTILPEIVEETETPVKEENEKLLSPLNERNHLNHHRLMEIRTPSSMHRPSCSTSLFSPTSNLPNYVIDGDAPHLKVQSPKRKLKENVDWLTKIRKQKLLSTINSQLNEKLNGQNATSPSTTHHETNADVFHDPGLLSPRMRKIKSTDRNGYGFGSTPSRRMSTCQYQTVDDIKTVTTPTRRNSETTILRFFCVTPTAQSNQQTLTQNKISNSTNHS